MIYDNSLLVLNEHDICSFAKKIVYDIHNTRDARNHCARMASDASTAVYFSCDAKRMWNHAKHQDRVKIVNYNIPIPNILKLRRKKIHASQNALVLDFRVCVEWSISLNDHWSKMSSERWQSSLISSTGVTQAVRQACTGIGSVRRGRDANSFK